MIIDLERRATSDLQKFELAKDSPDSLILIAPDCGGIEAGASLPINAGQNYFNQISGARQPFEKIMTLQAGDFVVIESRQRFKVPRNMLGLIHGKGRALFRGIMVAPGKIDPSFSGHLRIYLFNAGRTDVDIAAGEVLASVVFQGVETPYHGLEVGEGFPSIPPRPGLMKRASLYLKRLPRWLWVAFGAFATGVVIVLRRFW